MIKKTWLLVSALFLVMILVACGDNNDDANITTDDVDTNASNNTSGGPATDEETNNSTADENATSTETTAAEIVEVIIPAAYVVAATDEEIKEEAAAIGVTDYTIGDDGSVTYRIPNNELENVKEKMDDYIMSMMSDITNVDSGTEIQGISANEMYDRFTFTTTSKEAFESGMGSLAVLGLYVYGAHYQFLHGVNEADIDIEGTYVDENLDEFLTEHFPKDFQ